RRIVKIEASIAIDETGESPAYAHAYVIGAAVDVDSSGLGSIAAGNLEGSIMRKSADTRNVEDDTGGGTDGAASGAGDAGEKRITRKTCRSDIHRGASADAGAAISHL